MPLPVGIGNFASSDAAGQIVGTWDFSRAIFSARLGFPSVPLTAPGSPRMETCLKATRLPTAG